MKRKTWTTLLAVIMITAGTFFSNQSQAQEEGGFRLGLKAGMNFGWLKPNTDGLDGGGASAGFSWGAIGETFFAPNYAISTGINMHFMKGKFDIDAGPLGKFDTKYYLKYLEIPLMAKMKTNNIIDGFSFYGNIGLAPGFRLDAKGSFNDGDKVNMNDETNLLRVSMIVGLGAEYDIDSNTTLFAGINFNNGLTNVFKKDKNEHVDNLRAISNLLEVSVGIFF